MKADKLDFLHKHSAKHVQDNDIHSALKGMKNIPSVVSIPKKREAEQETEELEAQTNQAHAKRGKKTRRS